VPGLDNDDVVHAQGEQGANQATVAGAEQEDAVGLEDAHLGQVVLRVVSTGEAGRGANRD